MHKEVTRAFHRSRHHSAFRSKTPTLTRRRRFRILARRRMLMLMSNVTHKEHSFVGTLLVSAPLLIVIQLLNPLPTTTTTTTMSDTSSGDTTTESYLWVLFFSLFLILLILLCFAFCHGILTLCSRYRSHFCCCLMDWQAYQDEQESLQRLRRRRRQELIPPNYYMGFLLVPAATEDDSPIQERLTSPQRRRILERVLTWRQYSDAKQVSNDVESQQVTDEEEAATKSSGQVKYDDMDFNVPKQEQQHEGPHAHEKTLTTTTTTATSLAIPCHEEPTDSSCAICLDDFMDDEVVNADHKHVFHRECLLEWLDRHSVCPCCRRCVVTQADWKRGMDQEGIRIADTEPRYQIQLTHLPGELSRQQVAMMGV